MKKEKKPDSNGRLALGRSRDEARFTAPPSAVGLHGHYAFLLKELKQRIAGERLRAVLTANAGMVRLYWDIGKAILSRQSDEGWGAKVIDRLSADLRQAFPDMKGLSPRNLKYMRAFAEAWPERSMVQETLAQITWYHNIALIEQIKDPQTRLWYAARVRENGWSHNILRLQIEKQAHVRQGKALSNFPTALPPAESDMAAQVFKDPYLFDFLGTADSRREQEVERALVQHVQDFLLELGHGFAFVGRQVHLEVGKQDFYLDLLFYHLKLRCYVVVELKAVPFDPSMVGQLNLYLSAVDDLLRHKEDKPTIGLLLCRSKNKLVVEYALRGFKKPIGVAEWQTKLVHSLPKELKGELPSIQEIEVGLFDISKMDPTSPHPQTKRDLRR
jgi:predicted nuclease of restriction endonuclease-like (RecB) superfamily